MKIDGSPPPAFSEVGFPAAMNKPSPGFIVFVSPPVEISVDPDIW
jgi:hypothetical protein